MSSDDVLIDSAGLADTLSLSAREHVAFVGGGGKTTLLRSMALVGVDAGHSVLATTTTKMGVGQSDGFDLLLDPTDAAVEAAAGADRPVMVWSSIRGEKAKGVAPEACDRWFAGCEERWVLVEADGAKHRPFKAHTPFEPVIPSTTTVVVSVIGADALGRVIADQCHRPLRVAALADCSPYVRLTPQAAARVINHDRGVRQSVPSDARFVVVITKVSTHNRALVDGLLSSLDGVAGLEAVAVAFADG